LSSCHAQIEQLVSHDCKDLVERRDAKVDAMMMLDYQRGVGDMHSVL
jgi:hypothetical protein